MVDLKLEKTPTEEQETFIHIIRGDKKVSVTTHDPIVLKKLLRDLGEPTEILPRVNKKLDDNYVGGASWEYKYDKEDETKRINKIFKKTNYIPRKKNSITPILFFSFNIIK